MDFNLFVCFGFNTKKNSEPQKESLLKKLWALRPAVFKKQLKEVDSYIIKATSACAKSIRYVPEEHFHPLVKKALKNHGCTIKKIPGKTSKMYSISF